MPAAERILDFSSARAFLSVRQKQIIIRTDDQPTLSVPLEETAVVILAGPEVTLTQPLLAELVDRNATVVISNASHLPTGMLLPLSGNALSTQRLYLQVAMKRPFAKRLWQQVVRCKVLSQARALAHFDADPESLRILADDVRSGDPDNIESQAAARYWTLLFDGFDFQRRFDRDDANRLLNYGYAVLRAAVARAICGAGLHPALGIHHRARGNPFCLADDLMEPYRPLVDIEVRTIVGEQGLDAPLDPANKRRLVAAATQRLEHDGENRSGFEWFDRTAQSVVRSLTEGDAHVFYPDSLWRL